ncbi:hypothetical protein [Flavobacterium sp.]|uniref:hypothetical protein n=1 Tax=Flavobacterium sp. TaxID=239 RepID=UPI003527D5A2
MYKNKATLLCFVFYILAVVIYLSALIVGNYNVQLISKPLIAPLILLPFLLAVKKEKNNSIMLLIVLIFAFFYVSDMYFLFNKNKPSLVQFICCNLGYVCFVTLQISDFIKIPKQEKRRLLKSTTFIATVSALTVVLSVVLLNIETHSAFETFLFFAFVLEFILMIALTTLQNTYKINEKGMFEALAIICCIVSDLFFVFNFYFYELHVLAFISAAFKSVFYCFLGYYLYYRSVE